jgi:5-hydroxyisourate hydrolase
MCQAEPMATLSTHVLDTATGRPAAGMAVTLQDSAGTVLGEAVTDDDGRVRPLGGRLEPGDYRLTFATGDHFARQAVAAFHPRVSVEFTVTAAGEHYHVPLLLSPFGYTTYRGS